MKKKFLIKCLFSLLISALVMSCRFSFDEDIPSDTVLVSVGVDKYTGAESRTILPATEDGSTVSKFVLTGTRQGDGKAVNKEWSSYTDMAADEFELNPGTWDFELTAYKNESGVDLLFAKGSLTKTLAGETSDSLNFDLNYSNNTLTKGSLEVKVRVPYNNVKKVKVDVYNYDGGGNKQSVSISKTEYTPEGGSNAANDYSSITIAESNILNGYYFLQMDFYTDDTSTPTATRLQHVKIEGGLISKANLLYKELNKKYTLKLNLQLPATETYLVAWETKEYNSSSVITLPAPATTYRDFVGWYDNSDYTGTAITDWSADTQTGEVNLYAKWTPKSFPVSGHDFAGGQTTAKPYSGMSLPSELYYGATLPVPVYDDTNGSLTDGNEVIFAGWYTDKECTAANKITVYGAQSDLYAKWNYKYVYVDPSSAYAGSADTNRGYLPTEALKTIAEAKEYLKNNINAEKVYLLSQIIMNTAGDTTNDPSDLTSSTYNNVILQRHSSFNGVMISISCSTLELQNVIFDGGAVWDENGAAGVNTGLKAGSVSPDVCGTVMVIYNAVTPPTVTFKKKVVIQNNENLSENTLGGGVRLYGKLIFDSPDCQIRTCKSAGASGAIHVGSNSILTLNKGIIGGLTKADSNCAVGGGGVRIIGGTSGSKTIVNIGNASASDDGSEAVIGYNVSTSVGGGITVTNDCEVNIRNAKIIGNRATSGAGIYLRELDTATDNPSEVTVNHSFINENEATVNGGGVFVSYSATKGNSKYTQNGGTINGNKATYGGAVATNSTETTCTTLSNITITANNASNSGGAIYLPAGRFIELNNAVINNNICSAAGSGGAIYAVGSGSIRIGGTIDISDNHKSGSTEESNIFLMNNSATRYIKIVSPLSTYTGKSLVTTVDMSATKYPLVPYDASDASTYTKILNEVAANGYVASYYNLFGMENSAYKVNNSGQVYLNQKVTFKPPFIVTMPDFNSVPLTISYSIAGGSLTASVAAGYSDYIWIFNGITLLGSSYSVTTDVSSLDPGYYELTVVATDSNGKKDIGTVNVQITGTVKAGS